MPINFKHINITIEIICIIICFILLFIMATAEYHKEKLNKLFISLISVTLPLLFVDIAICVLEGSAGLNINFVLRAAYCLSFLLGAVLLILFTCYLRVLIGIKTTISKKTVCVSYAAITSCAINIVFIILTQFTGLYYTIDVNNIVSYGDFYLVSQASALLCILLNTGIILAYRKHYEKRDLVFLLSYAALPIIAVLVHNTVEGFVTVIDLATTLTILIFYAGIQSETAKRLKQKELELLETRVDIMLSQIQPHFLYNTLTTIENMIYKDADKASKMVISFSEYLRENMDSLNQKELVSFERELSHVKVYLDFEKMRFKDDLKIIYDCEFTDFYLPILTVQPIVENSVRHGIMKNPEGGTVSISTRRVGDNVVITVDDNGMGFEPSWSMIDSMIDGRSHIGLENVRTRIMAQCGGTLTIDSRTGIGTKAIITVPAERRAADESNHRG